MKDVGRRFHDYPISLSIDRFFCIGAMNWLKIIYNEPSTMFCDLFVVYMKMSYYQLNRDSLLREEKQRIYNLRMLVKKGCRIL